MTKPTVLIFIDWFDPAYKAGGPIVSVINLVKHLSQFCEFYIITSSKDYLSTDKLGVTEFNKWINYNEDVKVNYLDRGKVGFKRVLNEIKLVNPDLIYINGIFSFKYSILPLICAKLKLKKVIISSRGMLALEALKIKPLKKRAYLLVAKSLGLFRNVLFHVTKDFEMNDIRKAIGRKNVVKVVSNISNFIEPKNYYKEEHQLNLLYLGRIAKEKNTKYVIDLLSLVKNENVNINLNIYGEIYDSKYWSECLELIDALSSNISTTYHGSIKPNQIESVLKINHCLISPSLGENFGHSIVEALSAGLPVIISNNTPWHNLKAEQAGFDINLEEIARFKEAVVKFALMGNSEYENWSKNAAAYIRNKIDREDIINGYKELFQIDE